MICVSLIVRGSQVQSVAFGLIVIFCLGCHRKRHRQIFSVATAGVGRNNGKEASKSQKEMTDLGVLGSTNDP